MKIRRAYKFRLYPTKEQSAALRQHGGNTRFLWNALLKQNQDKYESEKKFVFAHDMVTSLPQFKKEHEFLQLSFSQSLQQVARQLDRALKDCFNKSKRFPVFKKKGKQNDSFTVPQKFRVGKNFVFIPKIGEVQWVKHRPIKGKVKHLTISQDGEQWYCSVNVELKIKEPTCKQDLLVGIDVGIKTYATMSDGSKIENPKTLNKQEQQLSKAQRRLSQKQKGSNNRSKHRNKVQRLHRKVKNARRDFQHKATAHMIAKYDGFAMEDLNIKGMLSNRCLSKAVSDCGWFEFKRQLRYKSEWAGKPLVEIGRFEPSSKTCSSCGWINKNLTLKDREFVCLDCGQILDRDLNAAVNIRNIGLKILRGTQESTPVETGGCSPAYAGQCQSKKQEKEVLGLDEHLCLLN